MAASTAGFPPSSGRVSGRDDDGLRRQSSVLPSTAEGGSCRPMHSTRWLCPWVSREGLWGGRRDCGIGLINGNNRGVAALNSPFLTSCCQPSHSKRCSFPGRSALHCPAVVAQQPSNSPGPGSTYAPFHLHPGRENLYQRPRDNTSVFSSTLPRYLCPPPLSQVIDSQGTSLFPLCQARVENHTLFTTLGTGAQQQTTA